MWKLMDTINLRKFWEKVHRRFLAFLFSRIQLFSSNKFSLKFTFNDQGKQIKISFLEIESKQNWETNKYEREYRQILIALQFFFSPCTLWLLNKWFNNLVFQQLFCVDFWLFKIFIVLNGASKLIFLKAKS